MAKRTGQQLSRGDRRRNAKLTRLRGVVRGDLAVVAVDLADANQAAVVCDHDSRVLGRRMFGASPWQIDAILDWAAPIAVQAGFGGMVLACEPTGYRWKPLAVRARARGVDLVVVQPLLVHRAREAEDLTRDRSDFKDATLIARLTTDLRCTIPHLPSGSWGRLRHLGAHRHDLLQAATAARQRLRDLLQCAWPTVLTTAIQPLDSLTIRACLTVATNPQVITAMDYPTFANAVADQLPHWHGARRNHRIMRAVYAAAAAPSGVTQDRDGACERAAFALADWHHALDQLTKVQTRMVTVLAELGLRELATTIPGLSAVGAAAILAETGDPADYDTARCWPKHAGLCPRDNTSGRFQGATRTSGRGRPLLRTAVWRAIWALLPHNPVFAARYRHLTTRPHSQLTDGQARAALGAALLRQLYVICHDRVAWDPAKAGAAGEVTATAA